MSKLLFDAVIVLSGGLTREGIPQLWVQSRLSVAVEYLSENTFLILNSRGTPHKAPILSSTGRVIDESVASARWAVENLGVNPKKILLDSWSVDTIGNAYFALVNHLVPLDLKKVLVVTSEFHMPRSRILFDHIIGLAPSAITVQYLASPNLGLSLMELEARVAKEKVSIQNFLQGVAPNVTNLKLLTKFIFSDHAGYNCSLDNLESSNMSANLLGSY